MRILAFRAARRVSVCVLLLACAIAPAAEPDGPYVLPADGDAWEAVSVVIQDGEVRRQTRPVNMGAAVTVPAVGTVPSFDVTVRAAESPAGAHETTAPKAPVFVVADTHGEYEILVTLLRAHQVLGDKLEWRYGRGHLVVLGDVFDRGPHQVEILWLLYRLQDEARRAGGGAHLVLGNHEAMVMRGDLRYLHAKYAGTARVLGAPDYSRLFGTDTLLGQWLRTRPAALRINDLLCVHAGISRGLVDSTLTLEDINAAVRGVLLGEEQGATGELVLGSFGPLWYRGYFPGQAGFPEATTGDVDLALKTYESRRILIGHTIVPTVTPLYGGKVIAVQVYPRRDENGRAVFEGLVFRDGEPWQARLDGGVARLRRGGGS